MAYEKEELEGLPLKELKTIAQDDLELDIAGLKKAEIVKAILDFEDDELDDELEDDEEDELDDIEEEIDDEIEDEPVKPKKKPKHAQKPDTHDGEETLAAKQVAALINTDAKTLRQFFRSPASTVKPVGSGGRYEFLESQVDQIRNEFAAWLETKATRSKKAEGGTRRKKERVIPEEEIAPEIEELDDELDELEDELLDDIEDDDELDD